MKISSMRKADRWLGVPVCFVLSIARLLGAVFGRGPRQLQRILFIKLAEQGSTVLAAGAIRRAVELVGAENVYFLVFQENRFILDVMELIPWENVYAIPSGSLFSTIGGAISAVRAMRRAKIDTAIDLEFFARSSAILCYLSGAGRRVGFHAFFGEASYRGDLMTHRLSFNGQLHASEVFRMMVDAATAPAEQLPTLDCLPMQDGVAPVFKASAQEVNEVKELLRQEAGGKISRLILLNPNCSDLLPLRSWPADRYVELAKRLLAARSDLHVVFTGGPAEAAATQKLAMSVASPRVISLAGKTTLRQLLVLYGLAEVIVTNDSGPAHFASMTPVDVVVLFGPEAPRLFAARTPRNHVLWAGIACSPCVNAFNDRQTACRNNVCMQRITVEQVVDEVKAACESRLARD